MQLKPSSLRWALKHVAREGDTDLFPVPFEFKVIKRNAVKAISELSAIDINSYTWKGPRRLIVPKSEFAFRSVCQLDPMDSILFAAMMKEIGKKIEGRRKSPNQQKVFSYRFQPDAAGRFYSAFTGWEQFWATSSQHCDEFPQVLVTDISDFYNQIYHHTIENQLQRCGISTNYWYAIKNLLANVTEGVSRGIPIGPHPSHLLAELAMNPVDDFLDSMGIVWCRYVDDIHIFCKTRDEGHSIIFKLVDYLDKTQKIQLNRQKTKIFEAGSFKSYCENNKLDYAIDPIELEMLRVVKKHTTGPYQRVSSTKISKADAEKLSRANIEAVLEKYKAALDTDYTHLRWFIRRLTQLGVAGGIPYIVKHFEFFLPAIAEVGNYFESAARNYKGNWVDIGDDLIKIYESGIVQASEYLQVVILSLFSRIRDLNHINKLTAAYPKSSAMCQRKIMLAAAEAKNSAWLSTLKGEYKNADLWKRRAVLYSLRSLPDDEKRFWLKSVKKNVSGLDELIVKSIS